MNLLSNETETALKIELLETVSNYLEAREKAPNHLTGLISAKQLQDELDIKCKTLQRWEKAGLRRYQAPIEEGRKVFYRVTDVLIFLGIET